MYGGGGGGGAGVDFTGGGVVLMVLVMYRVLSGHGVVVVLPYWLGFGGG